MARNGSGVYSAPAGTDGVANTTIESAKYNAFVADLVADANTARPIVAGGTGATTAVAAFANLSIAPTRQVLTVGSGTYTTPSGVKTIVIEAVAAGGGGGYSKPNASQAACGGGGGAGQSVRHRVAGPAASYSYTVGAGGAGGVAGTSTAATSGANTTFGSIVTAVGGVNGDSTSSTTVLGGSAAGGNGGGRAGGGVGDHVFAGEAGFPGIIFSGSICVGGAGGSSVLGGGGKSQFAPAGGQAGLGYGAGGSGGANANAANADGGAGADGIIYVWEFY